MSESGGVLPVCREVRAHVEGSPVALVVGLQGVS